MGWIADILNEVKDVPVSAVLKERVALAEQKYEDAIQQNAVLKQRVSDLENENASLRSEIPERHQNKLGDDTIRVLVQLHKARELTYRAVDVMAEILKMDEGMMQYHLDRLDDAKFAELSSFDDEHTYWMITSEGRRHVVEEKLV